MSALIFCFILTRPSFKIFLVLRYEKLMAQANHKWEIGFPLILVYLIYFIFKKIVQSVGKLYWHTCPTTLEP